MSMDATTVHEICKNFEPIRSYSMNDVTARGIEVTALASIAISLKRIADAMEKPKDVVSATGAKLTADDIYAMTHRTK